MGFIQVGKEKREVVKFRNEGGVDKRVDLKLGETCELKIIPNNSFLLKSNEEVEIELAFTPTESGIFRGLIEVITDGQCFLRQIDVNATCVEFLKFIINDKGEELTSLEFGTVLFGQRKKLLGYLVNNSPESFYFNVTYIQGLLEAYQEEQNLQTPQEVGEEQTHRILSIEPSEGMIESYSQTPLTFFCKSRVQDDHKIWTKNFNLAKTEINSIVQRYEYTAVFFFNSHEKATAGNEDSNKILQMSAKAVCPKITFETQHLDFGDCNIGDAKYLDLKVDNRNDEGSGIHIECPNLSQFVTNPKKISLHPGEQQSLVVSFKPKNLGNFNLDAKFLINKDYEICIKFTGRSLAAEKTVPPINDTIMKTGKMKMAATFSHNAKYISSSHEIARKNQALRHKLAKTGFGLDQKASIENNNNSSFLNTSAYDKHVVLPPIKDDLLNSPAREKAPDYLKQSRVDRATMRKEKKLAIQLDKINEQIRDMKPSGKKGGQGNDQYMVGINDEGKSRIRGGTHDTKTELDEDEIPPNDLKYLFKENRDGLDSPRFDLPTDKERLFVIKPIGPYEPYIKHAGSRFNPDPNTSCKPLPSKPNSHTVMRDCNQELDGEMLKRIQAGPKTIDFGALFVNSDLKKFFYIKNELKGAISARLQITHENVQMSYQKPQIILSGQDAGFMVNFRSSNTGTFSHIISYIINEKHTFKFMVKADVVSVNLELSNTMISLKFNDESLDMETAQNIKIRNTGNSNAFFSWFSPNPSLKVVPEEGFAEPYSFAIVNIIYTPQGGRCNEEDTLDMKIRDGEPKTLRVIASVNETRCEVNPNSINFGCLAVAQKSTINMYLKNTNPKWSAIYKIDTDSLPPNLEVKPIKGRVLPDNSEKLEVSYCSKIHEEIRSQDFVIKIRGSRSLNVPVSAKTIIPKLVIYENEFDFGTVTYGSSSTLNMT